MELYLTVVKVENNKGYSLVQKEADDLEVQPDTAEIIKETPTKIKDENNPTIATGSDGKTFDERQGKITQPAFPENTTGRHPREASTEGSKSPRRSKTTGPLTDGEK